ncbi:MAG: hypothetical protein ABIQ12_05120 [Opitutaceae bacterium]
MRYNSSKYVRGRIAGGLWRSRLSFGAVLTALIGGAAGLSAEEAVMLKNRRELFLDDFLVQEVSGLDYRQGVPVAAGTALRFDKAWEGQAVAYASVVATGDKFQMYYRGGTGAKENGNLTCYAESSDGIHWERPSLGLHEVDGSTANNVILPPRDPTWATENFSVLLDARPGVPADERYKAVGGGAGNLPQLKFSGLTRGLYRFVSADGIRWRRLPGEPLFTGYSLDSQNVLTWLPEEQCYAVYLRTWTGDKSGEKFNYKSIRTIARSVSTDFAKWSEPVRMTFDQGGVEDLYTNATQPYFRAPQILIAMPFRFVRDRRVLDEATLKKYAILPVMWNGVSDAVLMSSRGGTHYQRKFMESFVRPGVDPTSWAARSNMPALGVVQTGPAEMSFYIIRGYASNQVRIERMALRLDGFASLHAGYVAGSAITRPVILDGRRLVLNLSTSASGYAKVVVLDESGKEIPGFGEAEANELVGDAIELPAAWKNSPSLAQLKGRIVHLKFLLRDADLYSVAVLDQ